MTEGLIKKQNDHEFFLGKFWKPSSLKKIAIIRIIKMGGFEAKGCYFQLGSMGVNN